MFPDRRKSTLLNRRISNPEERLVINDGTPAAIEENVSCPRHFGNFHEKLFCFLKKWNDRMHRLMTGETPVASAAPNIPRPNGYISR